MTSRITKITITPLNPFSFIYLLLQSMLMKPDLYCDLHIVMFKTFKIAVVHVNLTDLRSLL